jgi:hypothetical protein
MLKTKTHIKFLIDNWLILVLFEILFLLILSIFDESNHEYKQYHGVNVS